MKSNVSNRTERNKKQKKKTNKNQIYIFWADSQSR